MAYKYDDEDFDDRRGSADVEKLTTPMYHVVRRDITGKILRDIFLTKNYRRAEIYARIYDGKIENV